MMTIESDGNGGSVWTARDYVHKPPDMEEYFPEYVEDDLHEKMFGYRPRYFRNRPHRELTDAEWAAWEWNKLPDRTRLIYALKRGYPFFWSPSNDYSPEDIDYDDPSHVPLVAAALIVIAVIVVIAVVVRL